MDNTRTSSPEDEPRTDIVSYHPDFNSLDGDIVLASAGGRFFRLHSWLLKTTSGFFKSMLSLPQDSQNNSLEVIYLEEDEATLELLFKMLCGRPVPEIDSFDTVDAVLFAAEKYDMPGPLSIVRLLVMMPPLLGEPFRLYTAATRFGWTDVAKFASTQTLTHNLLDPETRPLLRRLSTDAVLDLLALHHNRKEMLRDRLNKPPFVNSDSSSPAACSSCHQLIDYYTWRELKSRILREIEVRPLGDSIIEGLLHWSEARACWAAKCNNRVCSRFLYDQDPTIKIIRETIEDLPKSL